MNCNHIGRLSSKNNCIRCREKEQIKQKVLDKLEEFDKQGKYVPIDKFQIDENKLFELKQKIKEI